MSLRSLSRRTILALICVGCTAAVLGFHLLSGAYLSLELSVRDWLMTNPSARLSPRSPDLIYLGIDKASIDLDTLWEEDLAKSPTLRLMKAGYPWNREVYAAVTERLTGAGARAVVFDMLYPGPRDGDAAFRAALDRFSDRVVIGSNFETKFEDSDAAGGGASLRKPELIEPSPTLIPPGPVPDSRVGFVNVIPDYDGKIRRVHFRTSVLEFAGWPPRPGEPELYSLPARALQKAGRPDLVPRWRHQVMIRFSEPILPRSLHEIFVEDQWQKPPYNGGALFKDKIVVIGAFGNAAEDRLQTPHGVALGPTIHLSAINAALNRDFLHETELPQNITLIVVGGLAAWLIGTLVRRPLIRLVVLAAAIAGIYAVVQFLFNSLGFLPVLLSPLAALGTAGFTWSVWEQVLDLREKARLRRTFERYVSRDVVKELVDNPEGWLNTIGGARKDVTVLFSDVRGFTTLTEAAEDPHKLVSQLNEYFDEMVQIVFRNNGTLDKFIGDAVMAHWGSITTEGAAIDAQRAVATAVEMRETLARLNAGWKKRGLLELSFGIGVNHGEAIVGNLGCEAKMEFSMIGDAVNLGSRLEGVTKTYGIDLCIGEKVAPFVREEFIVRSLDLIVVKGKTRPVEIFAVPGRRLPFVEPPAWHALHEEAMQLYRRGEFAGAAARWREVLSIERGDLVSEIFLERCLALLKQPPASGWTGVFEMTSK